MSCCDSRDDRILRVFPEEESGTSYMNTAYSLLQNVVNRQQIPPENGGTVQIKERVVWTKIERWTPCQECVIGAKLSDSITHKQPFFLITIALENSLQLWLLFSHGACDLVCSLGGEDIRVFQHLTCPKKGCRKRCGPLAIKISANVGLEVASLLNLRSFDEVEKIQLSKNILGVLNNESFIAFAVPEEIYVYSNDEHFTRLFVVSSCYYDPGLNTNPMALGTQWLAFADARLVHRYECGGGVSVDVNSQLSYTSVLISAAQTLGKGLISITGSITAALARSPSISPGNSGSLANASPDIVGDSAVSMAGTPPSLSVPFLSNSNSENGAHYISMLPPQLAKHPGVVTVIHCSQFAASKKSNCEAASGLVAHFSAHTGAPLAFLQFSANGSLLATADISGREFNVFRILAHPSSVSLAAVHHLYSLHRGDTTATVVEMSFSLDSRWLVVGTHRGTAHVFPITPYGGSITRRTHCRRKVPNRFSRFHQSAGLDTLQLAANNSMGNGNGRFGVSQSQCIGSPRSASSPLGVAFAASGSPKLSQVNNIATYPNGINGMAPGGLVTNFATNSAGSPVTTLAYPSRFNSRLPPYPHPVPVRALYQIKQVISIPGLDLVNAPTNLPALATTANTSLPSVNVPGLAPISMSFSPAAIYKAPSQLISAAASLNSLTGSGLSNSLSGNRSQQPVASPASTTLCLVTWQGDLIEYKLSPRVTQNIPPEKLSQDSPIELEVEVLARWPLVTHFQAAGSVGGVPGPLYSHADVSSVCPCAIVFGRMSSDRNENCENCPKQSKEQESVPESWVSQVETFTCSSPSRRIWAGPQFSVQQYVVGRSDSANSLSPRPSMSSASGDLGVSAPSRTSLSTSPNVCQSEDSAFGEQERPMTPPSSASSSASGSLMTLHTRYSCPVDIQQHTMQISPRSSTAGPTRAVSSKRQVASGSSGVAVLEAYSSSLDTCLSDGSSVEAELLAAAVQDFQF